MAKQQARKKRRADRREDRRVLLWLLGCFPFGLVLMWRRGCRWPLAAKCAVSAVLVLLVLAIILPQTAPKQKASGGIQLVGREPSVEIFGPELPASVEESLANYDSILYNSATSVPVVTPEPETYVYVAERGKYYHTAKCKYYQTASRKLTLYEAFFTNYQPCPQCNPGVWERN